MERLLALDISSSTIGWAILNIDDNQVLTLPYMGYLKPPKKAKGSMSLRLSYAYDEIQNLIEMYEVTDVVVEAYAKRFTKGRSSANTIIVLSTFNEVCSLAAYQKLGKDTFSYPVISIRAALSKHFGFKIMSKDDIFPVINKYCKNFRPELNRNKKIREESGDVADAISVGLTHILKESKAISKWDI